MFTGIIEEIGTVGSILKGKHSARIEIYAKTVLGDLKIGDSVAVNGVCLTAVSLSSHSFTADVMHETLNRSSLSFLHQGSCVNLERAMAANGRFGGHIVTGHVDGIGKIIHIQQDDIAVQYKISAEDAIMKYIVEKGSIAIDGVSLTVVSVNESGFTVSIIPHTGAQTILLEKNTGSTVNLETDVIAKYVRRFTSPAPEEKKTTLTLDFLRENGF